LNETITLTVKNVPRLVEVMRRTGHLEDVPDHLNKSEEFVGARAPVEPGLNFCKGLFEWYSGNANGALKLFNRLEILL
jgi:tetratricopeptide repeat protein 21B